MLGELTPEQATSRLHIAALRGDTHTAALMISRGAYDFKTAYMNACENGDEDIRKYIFGATMRYLKSLGKAVKSWSYRYMEDMVAYGLMGACKGAHVDRVKVFLADPTVRLYVDCMCNCCNINPDINVVNAVVKFAAGRITTAHILCETPNCNHLRDPDITAILLPLLEKINK